MKTILIEPVSNGWIVRPFEPGNYLTVDLESAVAVFNTMEDLTAALPKLLSDLRGKKEVDGPRVAGVIDQS